MQTQLDETSPLRSSGPKSILSSPERKESKEKVFRTVSWTDMKTGKPLEKVHKIPGMQESPLRGSAVDYNSTPQCQQKIINCIFPIVVCILLGIVVVFVIVLL